MLSADPARLGEELAAVEKAAAHAIHWDIMDGSFVDSITFGHHIIAAGRKLSRLRFDVHLMIENPDKHLENFSRAGADVIIVHPETCRHLHRTLGNIKSMNKKSGIALNPATSIDVLEYCKDLPDMIVVMGVNPGSSGQDFIESQLEKISRLRATMPPSMEICVDGGINDRTINKCSKRGANGFVSGSYIFKSSNYAEAIEQLKKIAIG
jgi:ribulose-phosphate 3-epimerase